MLRRTYAGRAVHYASYTALNVAPHMLYSRNMSLNKLFSLHQRALIKAAEAKHPLKRAQIEAEADSLAADIAQLQNSKGAKAAELLPAGAI